MDLVTNGIHLQKILYEICSFFMRIFKEDEIPSLPEFILINDLYPNEQKFKIISFLISAAIDVFSSLPHKSIQLLVGNKIGLWRTLLVKMCLLNGADIHHLPLEIDIIASRNKLVIESLIFSWPFCNIVISDFLEYLCDSFQGSNNNNQPYIDEYVVRIKASHKRPELIKCIALCIKWVHAVQGSPSYAYTKDVLKDNIINLVIVSDIVMKNREGQFDEVWNEICTQIDILDEFQSTRIDSYPLYCCLNPLLRTLSDFIRSLLNVEKTPDFTKIMSSFHETAEKYETKEFWGQELTNTMLTALNTVMTEMLFKKCKSFHKISENNLKMFINTVAVNESISQVILMSEVNYWIDRLKRKKIELPLNIGDFFSGVWSKTSKEEVFVTNLEEYFQKVLKSDTDLKQVPSLVGITKAISDGKSFQKVIINTLKNATTSFLNSDPYVPPVLESKTKLIITIVERMAEHYELKLASHFPEKIARVIEKFNMTILTPSGSNQDVDDKSFIIPLIDNIDYKLFITHIWRCVNMDNQFLKPINIQECLIDIRHELFSKIQVDEADRIISRIMFFVGWRFKLRAIELLSDELFRFHLVFTFLGEHLRSKPLIQQNIRVWMRTLPVLALSKYNLNNQTIAAYEPEEFLQCAKLDVVKNHILQGLRGVKNISIPPLSDVTFPRFKRGLESTKAILLVLRQVFGKLNDSDRHKNDTAKYWLKNIKSVETDISIICCKLDADFSQVSGELNYLVSIIRNSIYDDADIKMKEFYHSVKSTKMEEDNSFHPLNDKYGSQGSLKAEKISTHESQGQKRKSHFKNEENLDKANKMSRLSHDFDDYMMDDDKEALMKWQNRILEKPTLQSKVNFIDNCSDIAPGDMIESRILHLSEPRSKAICIDSGKGKSRPPRFVEIEARDNRNPIMILKTPSLCSKRNTKNSRHNEFTSLFNFKLIRQVGLGTFGKVFEAVDKFSNNKVALKRTTLKNAEEGIPQPILREILLHKSNNHPNIIQFLGIVVNEIEAIKSRFCDSETIVPKSFYFVFEYMEHDLHGLMKSKSMIFSIGQIGFLSKQLFSALAHLHDRNIVHRDVTPPNILISNRGILKLADFGNARFITKEVNVENSNFMTPKIVSYLYRAPEILLDYDTYGTEVDIWSAGCVIYEVLTGDKLFSTEKPLNESSATLFDFLENMACVVGSPNQSVWPSVNRSKYFTELATKCIAINYSRKIDDYMKTMPFDAADVLKQIFQWDPKKRITAKGALSSNWLENVEMDAILITEFPDKDCHEYLLDHGDIEQQIDLEAEMSIVEASTNMAPTIEYTSSSLHDDDGYGDEGQTPEDQELSEEPLSDEDLKMFVDSLSGKILELGDILDRLRREPAYTPEICKGVIMRAAREWSGRERMRVKMVPFMLDYLLRHDEKDKLCY